VGNRLRVVSQPQKISSVRNSGGAIKPRTVRILFPQIERSYRATAGENVMPNGMSSLMALANKEALSLGQENIGAEHLLLALARISH
jgi:hypothetical protein